MLGKQCCQGMLCVLQGWTVCYAWMFLTTVEEYRLNIYINTYHIQKWTGYKGSNYVKKTTKKRKQTETGLRQNLVYARYFLVWPRNWAHCWSQYANLHIHDMLASYLVLWSRIISSSLHSDICLYFCSSSRLEKFIVFLNKPWSYPNLTGTDKGFPLGDRGSSVNTWVAAECMYIISFGLFHSLYIILVFFIICTSNKMLSDNKGKMLR